MSKSYLTGIPSMACIEAWLAYLDPGSMTDRPDIGYQDQSQRAASSSARIRATSATDWPRVRFSGISLPSELAATQP